MYKKIPVPRFEDVGQCFINMENYSHCKQINKISKTKEYLI